MKTTWRGFLGLAFLLIFQNAFCQNLKAVNLNGYPDFISVLSKTTDAQGNVYVIGKYKSENCEEGIYLVKFKEGNEEWTKKLSGSINKAYLGLDANQHLFLSVVYAGNEKKGMLSRYSLEGKEQFSKSWINCGEAMVINSAAVFLVGTSSLVKYSFECKKEWETPITGIVKSIRIDEKGNTYAKGLVSKASRFGFQASAVPSNSVECVSKCDPKGNIVWVKSGKAATESEIEATELVLER